MSFFQLKCRSLFKAVRKSFFFSWVCFLISQHTLSQSDWTSLTQDKPWWWKPVVVKLGYEYPWGTWINFRGYEYKSAKEFIALNSIEIKFRFKLRGKRFCTQTISSTTLLSLHCEDCLHIWLCSIRYNTKCLRGYTTVKRLGTTGGNNGLNGFLCSTKARLDVWEKTLDSMTIYTWMTWVTGHTLKSKDNSLVGMAICSGSDCVIQRKSDLQSGANETCHSPHRQGLSRKNRYNQKENRQALFLKTAGNN